MTAWICATCGVQYPDTDEPPPGCPICSDERQYVGWDGQQWTTMPELAHDHANEMREEEPALIGLGVTPSFGIGQRALLVRTPAGNLNGDRRANRGYWRTVRNRFSLGGPGSLRTSRQRVGAPVEGPAVEAHVDDEG